VHGGERRHRSSPPPPRVRQDKCKTMMKCLQNLVLNLLNVAIVFETTQVNICSKPLSPGGLPCCCSQLSIIIAPSLQQPQSPPPSGQHLPPHPPLLSFTITRISQPPRPPRQKLNHPQLSPATPPPPPPCSPMSYSFWVDAYNSARNRPLQTLLDTAHASCGVTVNRAVVRDLCVARGW